MQSNHSKSGGGNASSGKPLAVSETFNRDNAIAQDIASLSPAGRDKCRMIQELGAERLETEKRNQQRSHAYRVLKTKNELLEKYISNPAPRPESVRADPSADLKIIDEQAERMVRDREAHFLKNIERESEATVRQVIVKERQGQTTGREDRQLGQDEHER